MSRAPAMDERIRDRRQSVASAEARRRRRQLGSLAAVLGLLVAAVLVARSPLFSVTDVHVEGVSPQREDEVRDISLIRRGDNLLAADLGAARDRITALPWVADVEARRSPPSAVTLTVSAREPVVAAHAGGAAWLLDAQGVVIGGGAGDLPVIEVVESQLPPLGETVADDGLRNALAVHVALPAGTRDRVERYEAGSVQDLRVRVAQADGDAVWVRFGAADDVEAKAEAIELLLEELGREPEQDAEEGEEGLLVDADAVVLDVRAPNNPVVVPDPEADATDPEADETNPEA